MVDELRLNDSLTRPGSNALLKLVSAEAPLDPLFDPELQQRIDQTSMGRRLRSERASISTASCRSCSAC